MDISAPSCPPAVRARGLVKSFPRGGGQPPVEALRGIDLTINSGELIGLLGVNGAGKSTLVDMILGLTTPTDGTLTVCGMSPREAVRSAQVGAMLQSGGLLPDLSVRTTVRMIAATYPDHYDVDDLLERVGLSAIASRRVGQCSGGERQRLRFALAVLAHPRVLVLDEPTAGMDAVNRHSFWHAMRAEAAEGRTFVFTTHYIEEAQEFADRIVVLDQGRIIADGPTDEIQRQAARGTVAAVLPSDLDAGRLPGVTSVTVDGHRTVMTTADSDALARLLLTTTKARDLTVTSGSLEQAFLSLTADSVKKG